jgi:dihydroneopterin aldolase / 2-amino-4-hydroxy-6-hydroxymethyldihydropteridine diphosphokinase
LRVLGTHGALPEEQERAQPFEVDVDLAADVDAARSSDALADTVDYGAVAAVAARVVGEERHRLLERLASRVADEVLAVDPRVSAVTVTVRKLRPPVPVDLAWAAVTVDRTRSRGVDGPALRRAFLGLGSNLGDRGAHLRDAVAALPDVVAVSPVYESDPVGGPPGQPPYLNLVVALDTALSPRELLEVARGLEEAAGRIRTVKDGPRTLDVDVLAAGGACVDDPDLVVPHPRLWGRRFVLAPLADLAEGDVRRLGPLDRHTPG